MRFRSRKMNASGLAALVVLAALMTACGQKFKLPPDNPGPKAPNPEALIRGLKAQGKQLMVFIPYDKEDILLYEATKLSFSGPRLADYNLGLRGKWKAWLYCMTVDNAGVLRPETALLFYGFYYREDRVMENLGGIPIFWYEKSCDSGPG